MSLFAGKKINTVFGVVKVSGDGNVGPGDVDPTSFGLRETGLIKEVQHIASILNVFGCSCTF